MRIRPEPGTAAAYQLVIVGSAPVCRAPAEYRVERVCGSRAAQPTPKNAGLATRVDLGNEIRGGAKCAGGENLQERLREPNRRAVLKTLLKTLLETAAKMLFGPIADRFVLVGAHELFHALSLRRGSTTRR